MDINIQSAEVADENPGREAIESQFGGFGTPQEDIDTIVGVVNDAENAAIVDVELEITLSANGESTSTTSTLNYLMATENGDWKVVAAGGN